MFNNYTDALLTELEFYGERTHRPLTSIYFGGGTPSFLPRLQLKKIMNTVQKCFRFHSDCEITLEINPEDVDETTAPALRSMGVTRVSLGVQTFQDQCLRTVKRNHSSEMAVSALNHLTGGTNRFKHGISMDLMLGLPFQTMENVLRDLERWYTFKTEHLSIYLLERDIPVPLDTCKIPVPDGDTQADFYEMTRSFLEERGYNHYEISNFCMDGFESGHNLNYWEFGDYIGVGPAAHGRIGRIYWKNHPAVKNYINAVKNTGKGMIEQEKWTAERLDKERKMQGMRLSSGVSVEDLTFEESSQFEELARLKLVSRINGFWKLTGKGQLLANEVFEVFV
jgi:oxygen-independent coproporphyrinogen-3 oxidase